jgi:hypothetical protein
LKGVKGDMAAADLPAVTTSTLTPYLRSALSTTSLPANLVVGSWVYARANALNDEVVGWKTSNEASKVVAEQVVAGNEPEPARHESYAPASTPMLPVTVPGCATILLAAAAM